jgi:hypothetical protein
MSEKGTERDDRCGWTTLAICVVAVAEAAGLIAVIVWKLTQ